MSGNAYRCVSGIKCKMHLITLNAKYVTPVGGFKRPAVNVVLTPDFSESFRKAILNLISNVFVFRKLYVCEVHKR